MNKALSTVVKPQMIESREVAEMLEMRHADLILKLEGSQRQDGTAKQIGIIPVLTERNFPLSDYFIPSTYKDGSGKENKCYLFTKMGCEFIANKFTGEKGIIFTAKYVKKFNQMENAVPHLIDELERTKIEAQKSRADAMLLNAKNRTYKTLMSSIDGKNLSPIAIQVFGLKGLESVFNAEVGNYMPKVEKTYSATEIGEILGISANMVGRIAKANKLQTEEYGILVLGKAQYNPSERPTFRYYEKAIDKFRELIS